MTIKQTFMDLIEAGICIKCKTNHRAADSPSDIWCPSCRDSEMLNEKARLDRISTKPRMAWKDFVRWLEIYGHLAGLDFEWSYSMYEKHGKNLCFDSLLQDDSELEHLLNTRTVELGEDHPSNKLDDAMSTDWMDDIQAEQNKPE